MQNALLMLFPAMVLTSKEPYVLLLDTHHHVSLHPTISFCRLYGLDPKEASSRRSGTAVLLHKQIHFQAYMAMPLRMAP